MMIKYSKLTTCAFFISLLSCNQTEKVDSSQAKEVVKEVTTDEKKVELPKFKWYDSTLSFEERSAALVEAMTLEEKISLMEDVAKPIERLGVPEYNWWNECLHGVARNGRATVFPQAIGLAATFDKNLANRVATAISDEGRAKFNAAIALENRSRYAGLTYWTPNVNIFRDARWGRGQETYGEDPYLTSQMGVNFVKGLQGDHPKYLKSAACAKHYAVHSGPEELRHEFDAKATPKDLAETYLPAFEALVKDADVEGVMGAYNRVNGEPACTSPYLMNTLLRDKWGFDGYVTSDCWALVDIHEFHKVTKTAEESAALALNSGLNLNCGSVYRVLGKSIEQGLTTEAQLDKVLKQQLLTRFRLGYFDDPSLNPYNDISAEVVDSEEHREIALEAAQKSLVLLKNDNNVLPLSKDTKTMLVAGPHATSEQILLGNYFGVTADTQTILDGIVSKINIGSTVEYKQGILPYREKDNPIDWSTYEIATADVGVLVLGISGMLEGEEGEALSSKHKGDRVEIGLPQHQIDYIKKIRSHKTGNPLVLVLTGGSPIAIPEVYDLVDAILFVWYPGEEGGNAVADVLFGDVSPSGKLPLTFPKSVKDLPPYEDYNMTNRTYKYATAEPQFPFGFGLSYAEFEYSNLVANRQSVEVTVKNTSKIDSDEVVQLYVSSPLAGKGDPFSTLVGFERITLKAGETKQVKFEISDKTLIQYNDDGTGEVRKGTYKVHVGGTSPSSVAKKLGLSWLTAEI